MDWTGETSWISETSWRAGSIALAGGVCLGLALVHYTDPGVIKPNPHGVDPAVAEYFSMGRPVCEFLFILFFTFTFTFTFTFIFIFVWAIVLTTARVLFLHRRQAAEIRRHGPERRYRRYRRYRQ